MYYINCLDLDIASGSEMQRRRELKLGLNKRITFFDVVIQRKMLRSEGEMRVIDLSSTVITETELEFDQIVH